MGGGRRRQGGGGDAGRGQGGEERRGVGGQAAVADRAVHVIDEGAARAGIPCIKIMDVSAALPRVASPCPPSFSPLVFFFSSSLFRPNYKKKTPEEGRR